MKKVVIILSVVSFILALCLVSNILADTWYENKLEQASMEINNSLTYQFNSIDELKTVWPSAKLDNFEISPEFAVKLGVNFLVEQYSFLTNRSRYKKLVKTEYHLTESKDNTFYIVTILFQENQRWGDVNVAIDKKTGKMLHVWAGE